MPCSSGLDLRIAMYSIAKAKSLGERGHPWLIRLISAPLPGMNPVWSSLTRVCITYNHIQSLSKNFSNDLGVCIKQRNRPI